MIMTDSKLRIPALHPCQNTLMLFFYSLFVSRVKALKFSVGICIRNKGFTFILLCYRTLYVSYCMNATAIELNSVQFYLYLQQH